jgi:phytoene/squalene synthetase
MTDRHHTDLNACAALVQRGDPDRWLALMAAPAGARAALVVLYALNLELARAPWVTAEPLVARMRLQFWREVVAEADRPRAHEVAGPLARLIRDRGLPADLFEAMIAAREAEVDGAHLADAGALGAYVAGSSGALMALAVRALGGAADEVAQGYGAAQGMANYLLAVPAIRAAGRMALPPGVAVRGLAAAGLEGLARARAGRAAVAGAARPAVLAAWRAGPVLRRAMADPEGVEAGRLGQSEFARRGGLLMAGFLGV